jgi:hypothetical protein
VKPGRSACAPFLRRPAIESAPPRPPQPPTPAERQIASERAYAETKYRFERSFASDTGTSEWGRATEASLKSTLNALAPELARQVLSVDCRTKLCRVETEHGSHRESLDFMDAVEGHPGFVGARYVRIRSQPDAERYAFFLEPRASNAAVRDTP